MMNYDTDIDFMEYSSSRGCQSVNRALIEEISTIQIKMVEVLRENSRLKSELAQLRRTAPEFGRLERKAPFPIRRTRPFSPMHEAQVAQVNLINASSREAMPSDLKKSVDTMQRLVDSLDRKSQLHQENQKARQPILEETQAKPRDCPTPISHIESPPLLQPIEDHVGPRSSNDTVTRDIPAEVITKEVGSESSADRTDSVKKSSGSASDVSMESSFDSSSSSPDDPESDKDFDHNDSNVDNHPIFQSKLGSLRINTTGLPTSQSTESLPGDSPLGRLLKSSANLTKIILDDDEPVPTD